MIKANRLLPWSKFATWSKQIDYCIEVCYMIKANRLLPWSKFATWSKPIDYCLEVSLLHDQSQ